MNKDFWDKLGVVGTFLSSTLIVIFTTVVTVHTNRLSHQIEAFKTGLDENRMINDLVKELNENSTNVKYDFVLLSLERYLRNAGTDGKLKDQDREMLVGFAQSLILERKKGDADTLGNDENKTLIPIDFLAKYDTAKLNQVVYILKKKISRTQAGDNPVASSTDLQNKGPVAQMSDASQAASISMVLKRIIYIQYSDPSQKQEVLNIQQLFKNRKWVAPGIENVKGNYNNIIKFFHDEDREVADSANALLGGKYNVIRNSNPKYEKLVPKGQIELWINNK